VVDGAIPISETEARPRGVLARDIRHHGALEHLLQNAILFNREKGRVTIAAKADEEAVRLSVAPISSAME